MQAVASSSRIRLSSCCLCVCPAAFLGRPPVRTLTNSTPIIWPKVDRIPPPKEPLTTVAQVLKAAGRELEQYESKFETWEDLFGADGAKMKDLGLPCRERKYLMKQLQWYRLGFHPADMATKLKPKKKWRGHGPRVQKGKVVPEKFLFRLSHRRSIRRSRNIRKRNIRKYSPLRSERAKDGSIQRRGHSYTFTDPDKWNILLKALGERPAGPDYAPVT